MDLPVFSLQLYASWDALGVLGVVVGTPMLELNLLHYLSCRFVKERILAVVVRSQHQILPQVLQVMLLQYIVVLLKCLPEECGYDVDHRVVC